MSLLHNDIIEVLKSFLGATRVRLEHTGEMNGACHFNPIGLSQCLDIPGGKDMSSVKHGASVKRPCEKCLAMTEDNRNLRPGET